uniref:CD79a molecule n=1 Tax=Sphenodon punctatus TaxID=8508 RepID=A0A8D0HNN9_SPHPU
MERGPHHICPLLLLCFIPAHLCNNVTTELNTISMATQFFNTTQAVIQEPSSVPQAPSAKPSQNPLAVPENAGNQEVRPARKEYQVYFKRVVVHSVPTSLTVTKGSSATLICRFEAPKGASVTWRRPCSQNCSEPLIVTNDTNHWVFVNKSTGVATVVFERVEKNDSGMYYCHVESDIEHGQSCGTYLRVRKSLPVPFLNMSESTKNQIITAEGVLLLFCAIGPGLFLLFRKKWENERLLQAKKVAYEEENLYEGLNLDECSMYEDISRGLQATYQDVANIRVTDLQLEKPEKP